MAHERDGEFLAQLGEVVEEARERFRIPGIAVGVLRDGEEITGGWGRASLETDESVTADTLFEIGSNSKVFATTLLMNLVDDGAVELDAPVTRYLPELRLADESARDALRVRHLVSHQSGLWGDVFTDYGWGEDALARSVAALHEVPRVYAPGEHWAYTNVAFNIMGRIVEVLLDTPFETAMRERVLDPLGLDHTFYFPWEVFAYPHAVGHVPAQPGDADVVVAREYWISRALGPAGALHSTVGDMLAFDRFHLGLGGAQVISDASRRAMQRAQIKAANFVDEWGLGWWMLTVDGAAVIGHSGGTRGFISRNTLVPGHGVAWTILTNSLRGRAATRHIERWLFQAAAGLEDRDPPTTSLPDDVLQRYAGEYHGQMGDITATVEDGRLVLTGRSQDPDGAWTTQPPVAYTPVSERELLATEGDEAGARIDLIPHPDGRVRFLRSGGRMYLPVGE